MRLVCNGCQPGSLSVEAQRIVRESVKRRLKSVKLLVVGYVPDSKNISEQC
jgi:hypothetical protein